VVSSTPWPHFTSRKDPVPILQEAGSAAGPIWTRGKSRPYRHSIPHLPARSQSLYRLSSPPPHTHTHKMACVLYFSASFKHMVCDGVAIAAFGSIYFLTTIPRNPRVSNSQSSSVYFFFAALPSLTGIPCYLSGCNFTLLFCVPVALNLWCLLQSDLLIQIDQTRWKDRTELEQYWTSDL